MRTADGVEMLHVREAAVLAHRTPETIRRWVWAGRLVARRDGNRLLVARDDVRRLAAGAAGAEAGTRSESLEEWAGEVTAQQAGGAPGASASDLVLADRAGRVERAGSARR